MNDDEFIGCDGGDVGSPAHPSIWLVGIEHGTFNSIHDSPDSGQECQDEDYSVKIQLGWPYNRNAFKLLAALEGQAIDSYREFAMSRRIFEKGSEGYFKGNLYPYASRRVSEWSDAAQRSTGMDKRDFQIHCERQWFPVIRSWVERYRPRLVIGVGNSFKRQFSQAILGQALSFETEKFSVNGHGKRLNFATHDGTLLAVVPHISGSSMGLNSDVSLQEAGARIRARLRQQALESKGLETLT